MVSETPVGSGDLSDRSWPGDPFTLARIAGHSSITITQRYCHPQADAVEAAFSKFGNYGEVVTEAGHHEKQLLPAPQEQEQVSVAAD
jgi:hypothetical protein